MAFGVYHVQLGAELNLTEPDLGHPDDPHLWDRLYRRCPPGTLQCLECRVHRPGCPEWMYLRIRHDGRREAVHYNREISPHPSSESDAHKALKERIARAAQRGGFEAVIEQRPTHGRRRTDVLVRGAKVQLGCEPQLSPISAQTVRRRSRIAATDGVTPLWMTDSRKSMVIDQAPWARFDPMPWHLYLTDEPIPIQGGVRALVIERCERLGTVCPDRKSGRRCSGWHGSWEPRRLDKFDDLIVRAAAADLVPVRHIANKIRSNWFWVPAEDLAKIETTIKPVSPGDFSTRTVTLVDIQPRPLDRICRYLDRGVPALAPPAETSAAAGYMPILANLATAHVPARATTPATDPPAAKVASAPVFLDWSAAHRYSPVPKPCRLCGRPAHLLDDQQRPCHKVCAEREVSRLA